MATLPLTQTAPAAQAMEQRFRQLEAIWTAETGHLSSDTDIVENPAFQEIIGMGTAVVPFMLRDMQERPRQWVWALPIITGADPVPKNDQGKIAKMNEAWLRWGREQGY